MDGAVLGSFVCALVFALLIYTVIGAVFLRAAIALYNSMAGGPKSLSSVPEPDFSKAMGITFVTSLVNFAVGLALSFAMGTGVAAAGEGKRSFDLVTNLISFPISLLVMAAMLSGMLPTTFGRAVLVTLCYMLIVLLIAGVLVGIAFAVGFGSAILGK